MTRRVILRARAENDIRAIFSWYEAQQAGSGERFLVCLRDALEAVRLRPKASELAHKNVRRAVLGKFPYVVFYVTEPTRVVVLAILHTSRDPAAWPRH